MFLRRFARHYPLRDMRELTRLRFAQRKLDKSEPSDAPRHSRNSGCTDTPRTHARGGFSRTRQRIPAIGPIRFGRLPGWAYTKPNLVADPAQSKESNRDDIRPSRE